MDSKILTFLRFIKIEHTIFDLPFVFIGITYAFREFGFHNSWTFKIILIIIEAVLARISGMTMNRIIDLPLDGLNPRTKNRELVTGKIKLKTAEATVISTSLVFIIIAFYLNLLAGILSPIILLLFYLYPKSKKFPAISHFFMGFSIGLIVLAGYVGITAKFPKGWDLYGYSIFTGLWIATFDVIYQNQDWIFDKKIGMKSIPVLLEGKIQTVVIVLNFLTSLILLLSSFSFFALIFNFIASLILIISAFYTKKFDVDAIFKRFYLPLPFIILAGAII